MSGSVESDIAAERWAWGVLVLQLIPIGLVFYCLWQWDSPLASAAIWMLGVTTLSLILMQFVRYLTIPRIFRRHGYY